MKTFTLIATALFLSASILSVVQAAPPSDVLTTVVKFGDLDTTRPEGQEALYRRLTEAARSVCRPLDPSSSAAKSDVAPLYKACIDHAVSRAVAQIDRPAFSDYVASRMPQINRPDVTDYAATRIHKSVDVETRLATR